MNEAITEDVGRHSNVVPCPALPCSVSAGRTADCLRTD